MSRAFADITFTPSVKAAQELYGCRAANRSFELADNPRNELTEPEVDFIETRGGVPEHEEDRAAAGAVFCKRNPNHTLLRQLILI